MLCRVSVEAQISEIYRHLELEIDGMFKKLLLLRKKKYAATMVVGVYLTMPLLLFVLGLVAWWMLSPDPRLADGS